MSALSKRGTVEIAGIAERQTVQFPGDSSIVIRRIMKLSKDGRRVKRWGGKSNVRYNAMAGWEAGGRRVRRTRPALQAPSSVKWA